MVFQPIKDKVLVRPMPTVEESAGGIVFADVSQKLNQWGIVCACGEDVPRDTVTDGDEVMLEEHLGTHFVLQGQDYLIVEWTKLKVKKQ